jgi:hypothetical protein
MTPIEIYGHGQEFGQISRNNQQLFTMQDLGGESSLKEGNDSSLVPHPDLLNFCGFTVRTDLRVARTVRLGAIAE